MAEPVRPDGTAALWDVNATVDGVLPSPPADDQERGEHAPAQCSGDPAGAWRPQPLCLQSVLCVVLGHVEREWREGSRPVSCVAAGREVAYGHPIIMPTPCL